MFKWFKQSRVDPLGVSMAGAKLGDRVLIVGCSDPLLIAGLAVKAGLSGRACAVDESPERVTEAARVALREGALVETSTAAASALPFEPASFDLVVLRDIGAGNASTRLAAIREAARVVRPGGRCMLIDGTSRGGVSAMLGGSPAPLPDGGADLVTALQAQGFVAARTLAEREGLRFVEGVKRNA